MRGWWLANKSVKIIEHLKKTDYPSYLLVACAGEKRESAWMCMPRDEHNWIENREFRTIVNIHIINPLPELSGALGIKCPCAMGSAGRAVISGWMPYHLFNCPIDKASIVQTHDDLEQAVVDMCQMAGLQPNSKAWWIQTTVERSTLYLMGKTSGRVVVAFCSMSV